ncbi:hypothetical protein LCGC14_2429910 [marine sediment metagenome]|uniref:Uncharacterized protein n=1 Tax=marine sediment metagenome TaxID=412755 RepID=A0A0F9EG77_9ZZZZ
MTLESISIKQVENGWIITASGFTLDPDGDRQWESEEFIFVDKQDAINKVSELANTI